MGCSYGSIRTLWVHESVQALRLGTSVAPSGTKSKREVKGNESVPRSQKGLPHLGRTVHRASYRQFCLLAETQTARNCDVMKNTTLIGGYRDAQVHRVCRVNASDRVPDSSLRICSPNRCIPDRVSSRNILRLPHHVVMSEEQRQGRQSGGSVLVQESGGIQDIWHRRLCVDNLHRIQMVTSDRRYPDCGSIHILVGGGEQPHRPNETSQKNRALLG